MTNNAPSTNQLVHVAETSAERDAIYRLRYEVYVAEQGKQYDADHVGRILCDACDDDGHHLYIGDGGRVIAAARVHIGGVAPNPALPLAAFSDLSSDRLAYVSRLVVERSARGGIVTPGFFRAIYRFCVEKGVKVGFTWCVPALAPLYLRVGFREVAPRFVDPVVGEMVPLALVTDDVDYLRSIRSILAPLASAFHQPLAA